MPVNNRMSKRALIDSALTKPTDWYRLPRAVITYALEWCALSDFLNLYLASRCHRSCVEAYFRHGTQLYVDDDDFAKKFSFPMYSPPLLNRLLATCHNNIRVLRCASTVNLDSTLAPFIRANSNSLRVVDGRILDLSLCDSLATCAQLQKVGTLDAQSERKMSLTNQVEAMLRMIDNCAQLVKLDVRSDDTPPSMIESLVRHACVTELHITMPMHLMHNLAALPLCKLTMYVSAAAQRDYIEEETAFMWQTLGSISTLTYLSLGFRSSLPSMEQTVKFPSLKHFEMYAWANLALDAPQLETLIATITSFQWIKLLKRCPRLQNVELRSSHLYDEWPLELEHDPSGVLSTCPIPPAIDTLTLDGADIPIWFWPILMRMKSLTHLELMECQYPPHVLRRTVSCLSSLTTLIVSGERLRNFPTLLPEYLAWLDEKREREEKGEQQPKQKEDAAAVLPTLKLPSLRHLGLDGNASWLESYEAPLLETFDVVQPAHMLEDVRSSSLCVMRRLLRNTRNVVFSDTVTQWFGDDKKEKEEVILSADMVDIYVMSPQSAVPKLLKSCVSVSAIHVRMCEIQLDVLFKCIPPTTRVLKVEHMLMPRGDVKPLDARDVIALLTQCSGLCELGVPREARCDKASSEKINAHLNSIGGHSNFVISYC